MEAERETGIDRIAQIRDLEAQAQFVIRGASKAHKDFVKVRWQMGQLILEEIGDRAEYGTGAIDELETKTSVNRTTLRECRALRRHLPDIQHFEEWAEGIETEYGYIQWGRDVRTLLYGKGDASLSGMDPDLIQIERDAMRLERKTRKAMQKARDNPDEVDDVDHFTGVVTGALDAVNEAGSIPKLKVLRSPPFLKWGKANEDCAKCGAPGPGMDPHHVETGGTSLKGSDLAVVFVCRKCHDEADTKYQKWMDRAGWQTLHRYLSYLLTGVARSIKLPGVPQ